jgi:hypothetical protein
MPSGYETAMQDARRYGVVVAVYVAGTVTETWPRLARTAERVYIAEDVGEPKRGFGRTPREIVQRQAGLVPLNSTSRLSVVCDSARYLVTDEVAGG